MTIDLSIFDKKYLTDLKKNIINNPSTKKEFLEAFLKDESSEIRLEVIKSKYCTKNILIKALETTDENVYKEAERRLLSGEFVLNKNDIDSIKEKEEELKQQRLRLEEEQRRALEAESPMLRDAIEESETFSSDKSQNTTIWERIKTYFNI